MRFLVGVMAVWSIGCGGDGASTTVDAPTAVDLDTRARACAIIGSCLGYDATRCAALLDLNGTAAQVTCVLAATVSDCLAVRACLGQRVTTGPACAPSCVDGDTVVQCTDGLRVETDCTRTLENVGPACITNGRVDCGGATCSVDGEYTCDGTTSVVCDSGITEVIDCGKLGLECVAREPRCAGIASGNCTGTGSACDGDTVMTCDGGTLRRQDCKRFGGRTCVRGACAFGAECAAGPNTCIGTALELCLGGVKKSVDCTTIGATSCSSGQCR